jgi:hypothetical protein
MAATEATRDSVPIIDPSCIVDVSSESHRGAVGFVVPAVLTLNPSSSGGPPVQVNVVKKVRVNVVLPLKYGMTRESLARVCPTRPIAGVFHD